MIMKKSKIPRVAIVVTTFNRSEYVQEAIDSSLAQTYPCEVVVCDHGSTDDTPEVMKKYGDKIKYIRREKDFGPHFCWLDGILNADAEFIHIQHDDDWIDERFIEECVKLMRKDVGVVIADAYGMFKFKKIFGKTGIFPRRILEKRLLKGAMYSPSASLFRKKDLIDALYQGELPIQKYKSYHGVGPDSFMTLLAVLRYKKVGIVTEPLVFFREHEGSITIGAHSDPKKHEQLKNAYENVSSYYMFLKCFWLFDKLKYFSLGFWIREFKRVARIVLKKLGLFEFVRKFIGEINRILG
jgi:glycosyltransferase involved in cell wall biosynthesis